ncbi:MAG: type II toxin-antitoxin system VapC family toxin [Bryobacteraceae bacterium]
MTAAYFDTSVFIDIFLAADTAPGIRALLRELKHDKVRIYTSIITVQEVSVLSFRAGRPFDDNHAKVNKMARIQTITREIALTAAKLEAQILDLTPSRDQVENRRRKWDCFHVATAMALGCSVLYTTDKPMLAKQGRLKLSGISFLEPLPRGLTLFDEPNPQDTTVQ